MFPIYESVYFLQQALYWLLIFKIVNGIYRNFFRPRLDLKSRYSQNKEVWACVTGATDGLGYAFCNQLARIGFNILLVSRSKEKLERVQGQLWSKYPGLKFDHIVADFTLYHKAVSPAGWFAQIAEKIKEYDVGLFINNAGISVSGGVHYQHNDSLSVMQTIEVNTIPYVMLLRHILPKLIRRQAKSGIINVSSQAATIVRARSFIYSPTKRFQDQFTQSLSYELPSKVDIMSMRPLFFWSKLSNIEGKKNALVLTAAQCASGALDKLGYETHTAGHWMHNLQTTIVHTLDTFLPEFIYRRVAKNLTGQAHTD